MGEDEGSALTDDEWGLVEAGLKSLEQGQEPTEDQLKAIQKAVAADELELSGTARAPG